MTESARILVVEDEEPQRSLIGDILCREGFTVLEAGSVDEALAELDRAVPDLVVCDWRMPGRSGGDLLLEVTARGLGCGFVVMTAYGSISHAVEAIRNGADDYLAKPFEKDALLLAVRRVLRNRELEHENRRLRDQVSERERFGDIIGRARSMQTLYRTIEKVAATDATALVIGESGTGKELVARMLHRESHRARGPFVAVNCAAIPESLMESELFGHEKGSFTGAHRRRVGRFEEAEGGTLFLDEIASMPLPVQATLLRVLQDRRLTRVGGTGEIACDVRVVAATNRDLPELVAEGAFRDDLYYRLNVVPVGIPPLRERREDVPILAVAFLERACRTHGLEVAPLPTPVVRKLMEYGWPGNVRELANVVERLVLLAEDGAVRPDDLPPEILEPEHTGSVLRVNLPADGLQWEEMEADLLRQALDRAGGNRSVAARLLGLGYKAFLYRLAKHDLE